MLPLWALVFLALKLTGTVTWSWWWVMAPWWVTALLALLIAACLALIFMLARWAVLASAWLRFRHLPEFTLADPVIWSRIEAERPAKLTVPMLPSESAEPEMPVAAENCGT